MLEDFSGKCGQFGDAGLAPFQLVPASLQVFGNGAHGVLERADGSDRRRRNVGGVLRFAPQGDLVGPGGTEFKFEAAKFAQDDGSGPADQVVVAMVRRQIHQRCARGGAFGVCLVADRHVKSVALGVLSDREVAFHGRHLALKSRHVFPGHADPIAAAVLRLIVLGAKSGQPHDFDVHLGFLHDQRVARGDRLNLGVRKGGRVQVLDPACDRLAGHHLSDEFGFGLQRLPHVGVEAGVS